MLTFVPDIWYRSTITLFLLVIVTSVQAQKKADCACQLVDSSWTTKLNDPLQKIKSKRPSDSALTELQKLQKPKIAAPGTQLSKNGLFNGHLISYNASYVSRIEGVYDYGD